MANATIVWAFVWTEARLAGDRDPSLRKRVPRDRVAIVWAAPTDMANLKKQIDALATRLSNLPQTPTLKLSEIGASLSAAQEPTGVSGDD